MFPYTATHVLAYSRHQEVLQNIWSPFIASCLTFTFLQGCKAHIWGMLRPISMIQGILMILESLMVMESLQVTLISILYSLVIQILLNTIHMIQTVTMTAVST